jgi:hypothetical protein
MGTFLAGRGGTRNPGNVRRVDGGVAAARLLQLIAAAVATLLLVGILLIILGANRQNEIVGALLDAARWLAGPFANMFELDSRKAEVAVNWGIAAVVYLVIANVIGRVLVR